MRWLVVDKDMKGMRWTIRMATLLMAFGMVSCDRKAPSPQKPKSVQPLPGSPEEVVLVGEGLRLTMGDYKRCIDVHRIQGHDFSKRALANPRFQRDEIQRCAQTRFLRDYIQKNNIQIIESDRAQALKQLTAKHGVADEAALASKLGISPALIHDEIDDTVLPIAVQRALVADLSESQARQLFNADERRLAVEIARFDNSPTDNEIAAYLEEKHDALTNYLVTHQELLKGPAHVKFVRMGYAVNGDENVDAEALRNAQQLRIWAVQHGLDAALKKCLDDQEKGCMIVNDKDNPWDEARSDENAWAFRMPVGSVSEIGILPVIREIKISLDIIPPAPYDLSDPKVQSLLAHHAMSNTEPAPHLIDVIKPALENQTDSLSGLAEKLGGSYATYQMTLQEISDSGEVQVPEIINLLATMQTEEVGLYSNPILHEEKLYIVHVTDIEIPDAVEFALRQTEWRDRRAADPKLRTVNVWIQNAMPKMTTLNIVPVQTAYGILQANGSIR